MPQTDTMAGGSTIWYVHFWNKIKSLILQKLADYTTLAYADSTYLNKNKFKNVDNIYYCTCNTSINSSEKEVYLDFEDSTELQDFQSTFFGQNSTKKLILIVDFIYNVPDVSSPVSGNSLSLTLHLRVNNTVQQSITFDIIRYRESGDITRVNLTIGSLENSRQLIGQQIFTYDNTNGASAWLMLSYSDPVDSILDTINSLN